MEADPLGSPRPPNAEALVTGGEIGAPCPISVLAAGGFRVCAFSRWACSGRSGQAASLVAFPWSRFPLCVLWSRSLVARNWPCGPPGRIERACGPRATTVAGPWPPGLQRLRARGPQGYNGCGPVAPRATTAMVLGDTGLLRAAPACGSRPRAAGTRGSRGCRGMTRVSAGAASRRDADGAAEESWAVFGAGGTEVGAADLGEWRGGSRPGPFERRIFWLCFDSELVVAPGSDTVLTQRRSDPADWPGVTRDRHADVAQLVEHHLAKVRVAGSNPVVRSEARLCGRLAAGQPRSCGGVAEWLRQGPAKPCTRVRFPSPPPLLSL